MIYLIGGIPRSGKSILSKKITKKISAYLYSTDALTQAFYHGMPDLGIGPEHNEKTAIKLMPFTKGLVHNYSYFEDNVVIEGVVLEPRFVSELVKEYPNLIKPVFLGYANTTIERKYSEIKKHARKDDWLVAYHDDEYIIDLVKECINQSKELKLLCDELCLPYYDVSTDFNVTIDEIVSSILLKKGKG